MVREARFAWDSDRPLPEEISRRDWDLDDPDVAPPRRRRRRDRTNSTIAEHNPSNPPRRAR